MLSDIRNRLPSELNNDALSMDRKDVERAKV